MGAAVCQLLLTFLIPHVAVGIILPFVLGGIIWMLLFVWPYYWQAYNLCKRCKEVLPEPDATSSEKPSDDGAVVSSIIRAHSDVARSLSRTMSFNSTKLTTKPGGTESTRVDAD